LGGMIIKFSIIFLFKNKKNHPENINKPINTFK
jgi:hypothetical protein